MKIYIYIYTGLLSNSTFLKTLYILEVCAETPHYVRVDVEK